MTNERFLLVKRLQVVGFSGSEKGRIATLLPGQTIEISGASSIPGCIQVLCGKVQYSVFEEDLRSSSTTQNVRGNLKSAAR
jgi:uncharacterized membrane protein YoaK (UPF0700 family)